MNIYNFTKQELADYLISNGFKKYNATQIFEWVYHHSVNNFDDFSNISKKLLEHLKENFTFGDMLMAEHQHDGDAHKFLIKLTDNEYIEAVLMHHRYGDSLCLSTQVGCNMDCRFCASGKSGKIRNLDASEIIEPIILIGKAVGVRVSHVVLMGIGEPLDNYEQVTKALTIMNDPHGLAIGARHITISTCGLTPKIKEFADFPLQINLAVSLHAPNDEIRNKLMKINRAYSIRELISACKYYIKKTNRRITFEYIMLKDINDSLDNARELVSLIRGMNAYINLIPYNKTGEIYEPSSNEQTLKFYDCLKKSKINVTIRKEFGSNIDAACGQLRIRNEECQ